MKSQHSDSILTELTNTLDEGEINDQLFIKKLHPRLYRSCRSAGVLPKRSQSATKRVEYSNSSKCSKSHSFLSPKPLSSSLNLHGHGCSTCTLLTCNSPDKNKESQNNKIYKLPKDFDIRLNETLHTPNEKCQDINYSKIMKCRETILFFLKCYNGREKEKLIEVFRELDNALFEKLCNKLSIEENNLYCKMYEKKQLLISKLNNELENIRIKYQKSRESQKLLQNENISLYMQLHKLSVENKSTGGVIDDLYHKFQRVEDVMADEYDTNKELQEKYNKLLVDKKNLDEEYATLLEKYNAVCSLNIEFSQKLTDINGQKLEAEKKYDSLMKDYNSSIKKCSELEKSLRKRDLILSTLNSFNEISRKSMSRRSSLDMNINPNILI